MEGVDSGTLITALRVDERVWRNNGAYYAKAVSRGAAGLTIEVADELRKFEPLVWGDRRTQDDRAATIFTHTPAPMPTHEVQWYLAFRYQKGRKSWPMHLLGPMVPDFGSTEGVSWPAEFRTEQEQPLVQPEPRDELPRMLETFELHRVKVGNWPVADYPFWNGKRWSAALWVTNYRADKQYKVHFYWVVSRWKCFSHSIIGLRRQAGLDEEYNRHIDKMLADVDEHNRKVAADDPDRWKAIEERRAEETKS